MKFWIWLLSVLEAEMVEPKSFGWYHLMWVVLICAFTVFMCIKLRDCSDKTARRLSLIIFIVLIVADLYKQITYDFVDYNSETGKFVWDYSWYSFPFQLCSSPHYILPFVIWMKDGRVRDACIGYLSFFSMVGGLCVFVYPESCLVESIGVNIQTMLHHGMQIFLAVFFAVHERRKFNVKYYLRSIPVMLILISIAMVLNVTVYNIFQSFGIADEFNMFYISPYFESTLPLVGLIQPLVPYPVFFMIYVLGLTAGGFVVYSAMRGFIALGERASKRIEVCNA